MRLFADQQDRHRAVGPQGEVEGQPAQHRDDDVQDFRRHARGVEDGDRLAVHRHAEDARQQTREIVAHHDAGEHEGIAAVRLQGQEAILDAHIRRQFQRALVFAHHVVDDPRHVRQAVRDRRVDGDVVVVGTGQLALGFDDHLVEDRGLDFRHAAVFADHQFLDFVEVQQPVRQLQIGRADHLAQAVEGRPILVVRIEDDDVAFRMLHQDAAQDSRQRAGLAGAGGAQHGEMLAQQVVGEDVRGDRIVEMHAADPHALAILAQEDAAQIVGVGGRGAVAQLGEGRHAAAEPATGTVGFLGSRRSDRDP